MLRRLPLAVLLFGCGNATLRLAEKPPPAVRDDKFMIEGRVCADEPKPLEFPLKVLFIVDASQSMNITDPPPVTCTGAACLTRRGAAMIDVLDRYPAGNGVTYALERFGGTSGVLTKGADGNDGFTDVTDEVKVQVGTITIGGEETNYEGALATAFKALQTDMINLDATARSRAKYVVIFMSDGLPSPANSTANNPTRILQRVDEIKALEREQRLAKVELHTVYLSGPDAPESIQLVAKNLLEQMAKKGEGSFRSFTSGDPISFFYIDFRAFIRTFAMKSFVAQNTTERTLQKVGQPDSDGDGLLDIEEEDPGTDPFSADSDGDGFSDLLEVRLRGAGFDPNFSGDGDCTLALDKLDDDGDQLLNCEERFIGSNPRLYDSDGDGIGDRVEFFGASNPAASDVLSDPDFDGVRTGNELAVHTDPNVDDSVDLSLNGYRYTVKELDGNTPGLPPNRRCYSFAVENITLAPTQPDGLNRILLMMDSAPLDSPDDFGNHQVACVLPRFSLSPDRKVPATGKMTIPYEAFKKPSGTAGDPEVFDAERDCIKP